MPDPVDPPNPPAPTPPAGGTPPTPPVDKNNDEEFGKVKKTAEELTGYKERVDPVLQTIWSNPDLFKAVEKAHAKRLNIPYEDKDDDDGDDPAGKGGDTPPAPSEGERDNRKALLGQTAREFEREHGLNALSQDNYKIVSQAILVEVKDMLDPKDNKTLQQVLDDVPLAKLPRFFDKALRLVRNNPDVSKILEENEKTILGQRGDPGVMGSYSSGSLQTDDVTLTEKEKEIARKQGITEELYLKNKKKIMERKNKPL